MILLVDTLKAGIVLGGIFSLAAIGIVLVYRVTGVLNFAHGAMGMFSTFVAWKQLNDWHPLVQAGGNAFNDPKSIALAVTLALAFSVVLGLALEFLVFKRLRGRSQVTKAVVTVGLLLALQYSASIIFGGSNYHQPIRFFDPSRCGAGTTGCYVVHFGPQIVVGYGQILVIAAALILAGLVALFLRFTRFGSAMRAVSDDPVAASLWGVPVNLVGSVSWMLGSLLAATSGILLTSVGVNFDTVSLTVLVVDALAAALIGGLVSLPLTVLGGFILGLLETVPRLYIFKESTGFPKTVAIGVILAVLLVRTEKNLLRAKE
ncbi:MAG: branched-chain amino acid ABC transporter permease [Candidatus Dormibacteria bacterium]